MGYEGAMSVFDELWAPQHKLSDWRVRHKSSEHQLTCMFKSWPWNQDADNVVLCTADGLRFVVSSRSTIDIDRRQRRLILTSVLAEAGDEYAGGVVPSGAVAEKAS